MKQDNPGNFSCKAVVEGLRSYPAACAHELLLRNLEELALSIDSQNLNGGRFALNRQRELERFVRDASLLRAKLRRNSLRVADLRRLTRARDGLRGASLPVDDYTLPEVDTQLLSESGWRFFEVYRQATRLVNGQRARELRVAQRFPTSGSASDCLARGDAQSSAWGAMCDATSAFVESLRRWAHLEFADRWLSEVQVAKDRCLRSSSPAPMSRLGYAREGHDLAAMGVLAGLLMVLVPRWIGTGLARSGVMDSMMEEIIDRATRHEYRQALQAASDSIALRWPIEAVCDVDVVAAQMFLSGRAMPHATLTIELGTSSESVRTDMEGWFDVRLSCDGVAPGEAEIVDVELDPLIGARCRVAICTQDDKIRGTRSAGESGSPCEIGACEPTLCWRCGCTLDSVSFEHCSKCGAYAPSRGWPAAATFGRLNSTLRPDLRKLAATGPVDQVD